MRGKYHVYLGSYRLFGNFASDITLPGFGFTGNSILKTILSMPLQILIESMDKKRYSLNNGVLTKKPRAPGNSKPDFIRLTANRKIPGTDTWIGAGRIVSGSCSAWMNSERNQISGGFRLSL